MFWLYVKFVLTYKRRTPRNEHRERDGAKDVYSAVVQCPLTLLLQLLPCSKFSEIAGPSPPIRRSLTQSLFIFNRRSSSLPDTRKLTPTHSICLCLCLCHPRSGALAYEMMTVMGKGYQKQVQTSTNASVICIRVLIVLKYLFWVKWR